MMSLRLATAAHVAQVQVSRRLLSSTSIVAVEKLRNIFEEYRLANYTQELPSRFKKEVLSAAADKTNRNVIPLEGLERVLTNIGALNRLNKDEIKFLFDELGYNGAIPKRQMEQLI